MRILFITHIFSDQAIGGEARISWELSRALAKRGLEVFVVAPEVRITDAKLLSKNLKVFKIPFCHPAPGLDHSNMLRTFLFSLPLIFFKKIRIIHLASSNGPCPFSRFKFGRVFIESADIGHDYNDPKIKNELEHDRKRKKEAEGITFRPGFSERIFDKLTLWFYQAFSLLEAYPRGVDIFACRANAAIEYLRSLGYTAKLFYVPNGVDTKHFRARPKPADKKDKFTFLFVGKLTKSKGLLYLIGAFSRLKKEGHDCELVLIGSGAESTEKEIKNAAVGIPAISFLGKKSADEIKNYYSTGDIFVMPSLSEGFGIANLEAMACGRPVISTRVGGIVDVVVDGQTGFLIEPADSEALYGAMKKALESPELLETMGRKARERAEIFFSWTVVAEKLFQVYTFALKEND